MMEYIEKLYLRLSIGSSIEGHVTKKKDNHTYMDSSDHWQ